MKTYRRIEITAFQRRLTIVSGEWPQANSDAQASQTDETDSLNDTDSCEPVEPESPEGQLILADAVRSLERRLSPARTTMRTVQETPAPKRPNGLYLRLQSFYQLIYPKALRFARKEK